MYKNITVTLDYMAPWQSFANCCSADTSASRRDLRIRCAARLAPEAISTPGRQQGGRSTSDGTDMAVPTALMHTSGGSPLLQTEQPMLRSLSMQR